MNYAYKPHESLLQAFDSLFRGKIYRHRDQSLGNWVAAHLFNDLLDVARSAKFVARVNTGTGVRHRDKRIVGGLGRRGDGAFGALLPGASAIAEEGFAVKRGPVGQVEIGAETKILSKTMVRQLGRVVSDLEKQVLAFQVTKGNPICIALIGVNHAAEYMSREGRRKWKTTGQGSYPHPIQEAHKVIDRLIAVPGYDEKLILPYSATNYPPYDFFWEDFEKTREEYSALLVRVSSAYESRF